MCCVVEVARVPGIERENVAGKRGSEKGGVGTRGAEKDGRYFAAGETGAIPMNGERKEEGIYTGTRRDTKRVQSFSK